MFGLMPWDLERLTEREAQGFLDALDERAKAMKKGR